MQVMKTREARRQLVPVTCMYQLYNKESMSRNITPLQTSEPKGNELRETLQQRESIRTNDFTGHLLKNENWSRTYI